MEYKMAIKTHVLIVDDDQGITETLSDILTDLDYKTDVANDGYEAIQKIKNNGYDVVLMDIKMPGLNGVETFIRIKKIRPSIKVIMVTAYAVEQLIDKAKREGAYEILYKPVVVPKIIKIIEKLKKEDLIMIVDDDMDFCNTLKDVLNLKHLNTIIAKNGEEAIELVKEKEINIIFIDMKLPGKNGLDTYLQIRKVNPNITVIIMSGNTGDPEMQELITSAINNSAHTFIPKPLDLNRVFFLISEITNKKF